MPLLEACKLVAVGSKKCNIAKAQDKDLKIAIINMSKYLK